MLSYKEGRYKARIKNWGLSKASTGTDQFFVSIEPLGMFDPADQENLLACDSAERTIFRAITDKTIDFVLDDLERLGYKGDTFDQLNPEHAKAHNFRDQEIEVRCRHETYKDKLHERWEFAGGGSFQPKPLAANEVNVLNKLFGKKLKARAQNGKKPNPITAPENAEVDGAVPF